MASTKADLRQLNVNSRATVDELKAFLRELKGRSPQEMLGLVAASQLLRSVALATVVVALGIAVFTIGPFLWKDDEAAPAVTVQQAPAPTTPTGAQEPSAPSPPADANPASSPADEAIEKLGVAEEKAAPLNANPLENKGDDFLKGLE